MYVYLYMYIVVPNTRANQMSAIRPVLVRLFSKPGNQWKWTGG